MNLHKVILTAVCAVASTTALADVTDIKAANNQVGIQYISTHVDYKETGNGNVGTSGVTLDTEKGSVSGYALSLSTMQDWWLDNDYLEIEFSRNNGHTDYVGSLQGGVYGDVTTTSGATLTDYHLRYGKGFAVGGSFMITPYAELGHHKWDRDVGRGGPGGVLENYKHNYYSVGVLAQFSPMSKLVLSGDVLIGRTFGSDINVVATGYNSLGNSTLYRIGASADYAFTANVHGNIGVDYTAFDYGASAWQAVPGSPNFIWAEPDSTSKYTTFKVGIGYSF